MPVTTQFIATKALIICDGKVLLLQESTQYKDGTSGDNWDVPGGRIETGQHFAESLAREVKEECGLVITSYRPVHVDEWRPTVQGEQWQIVGIYFLCEVEPGDVTLSQDHKNFEWIPLNSLDNNRTYNVGVREAIDCIK